MSTFNSSDKSHIQCTDKVYADGITTNLNCLFPEATTTMGRLQMYHLTDFYSLTKPSKKPEKWPNPRPNPKYEATLCVFLLKDVRVFDSQGNDITRATVERNINDAQEKWNITFHRQIIDVSQDTSLPNLTKEQLSDEHFTSPMLDLCKDLREKYDCAHNAEKTIVVVYSSISEFPGDKGTAAMGGAIGYLFLTKRGYDPYYRGTRSDSNRYIFTHELGHVLKVKHTVNDPNFNYQVVQNNIMTPTLDITSLNLTGAQIATAKASPYVVRT